MVTLAQSLPILGGCGGTTLDRKMMAAGPIRSGSDGMIPGKGRKMTASAKERERDDRNYDFAKRKPIARYCGRESKKLTTLTLRVVLKLVLPGGMFWTRKIGD